MYSTVKHPRFLLSGEAAVCLLILGRLLHGLAIGPSLNMSIAIGNICYSQKTARNVSSHFVSKARGGRCQKEKFFDRIKNDGLILCPEKHVNMKTGIRQREKCVLEKWAIWAGALV